MQQLLDIHQLSDYEKFDMMTKMKLMGCKKPSQKLLHAMLEFCPVGMEKHISPSTTSACRDFHMLSDHSWERQAVVCPLSHKRWHCPAAEAEETAPGQHHHHQG
jgi:hypothetical protein